MSNEEKVRVIISNEGGVWVAQCLEYDICVQADDLNEIPARFEVAMRIESDLHKGNLASIGKAPKHFFDQWERRAGAYTPANDGHPKYEMALAA